MRKILDRFHKGAVVFAWAGIAAAVFGPCIYTSIGHEYEGRRGDCRVTVDHHLSYYADTKSDYYSVVAEQCGIRKKSYVIPGKERLCHYVEISELGDVLEERKLAEGDEELKNCEELVEWLEQRDGFNM